MTDQPKEEGFPSWRYGPEDQAQIFNSAANVPKGWEDHPSKVAGDHVRTLGGVVAQVDERKQIIADLKALGVTFFPGASTDKLRAKLDEATKPA